MRFLHTADWHLGRLFHGRSLIEDQAWALDRFIECVRDTRPDAVLIAGDVYDRAVPPAEAVSLLDDTLARIVVGEGVPVVLIAGNHDSPERIGFGSRLFAGGGLTVAGRSSADVVQAAFEDVHGRIVIHALPYTEPAVARDVLAADIPDHAAAMRELCARARVAHPSGARSVLLAHAFVTGGAESESERPLSIGGSGAVPAECFDGFDYVALGHLHRPQTVGSERIRYSGSLLKYSLSEVAHQKSVSLVELGARGEVAVEAISLGARRDLRRIEGELAELVAAGRDDSAREDYVFATLTDVGALLDPVARLREVYPNVLGCERSVLLASGRGNVARATRRELDVGALFGDFFLEVTGTPLDEIARRAVDDALDAGARDQREAG